MLRDCVRKGRSHGLVAVTLEEVIELLEALGGALAIAVRDLGEQREGVGAEVEQLLASRPEIALSPKKSPAVCSPAGRAVSRI